MVCDVTATATVLRAFATKGAARTMNFCITETLYRVQVMISAFTEALHLAKLNMVTTSVYHIGCLPILSVR